MLVHRRVCSQHMIGNEHAVVPQVFNCLDKGANLPQVSADFGLRKDSSDFHYDGPCAMNAIK
jgi:hypothetical protein